VGMLVFRLSMYYVWRGGYTSDGRLAIQEYEALCPDANRRTLQRDLRELVDKDLLNAEGATNRLEYRLGRRGKP